MSYDLDEHNRLKELEMKVKFTLGIGYSGANREEEVELPDDWTEDQIHQELLAWSDEYIDVGFDIIEEEDSDDTTV